ncbi:hypothetical protein QTP88_012358 [Uroleucon formosanum]
MKVHTACVDTLNITIFHNGKNMLINQQFARLMLQVIRTSLFILLTSVNISFNLVNRSSFPRVGRYLASAIMYGATTTAATNPTRNNAENLPAIIVDQSFDWVEDLWLAWS